MFSSVVHDPFVVQHGWHQGLVVPSLLMSAALPSPHSAVLPPSHLSGEVPDWVHTERTAQPQMPRVPLLLCQWIHTVSWIHGYQMTCQVICIQLCVHWLECWNLNWKYCNKARFWCSFFPLFLSVPFPSSLCPLLHPILSVPLPSLSVSSTSSAPPPSLPLYVFHLILSSPPPPSRYVPTDWANKTELTLEEVNQLNKLNLELAASLTQRNPIYTPFQHGNFTCIMIREVWTNLFSVPFQVFKQTWEWGYQAFTPSKFWWLPYVKWRMWLDVFYPESDVSVCLSQECRWGTKKSWVSVHQGWSLKHSPSWKKKCHLLFWKKIVCTKSVSLVGPPSPHSPIPLLPW